MANKLLLYNFSAYNICQKFFYNVCVVTGNCFYFCPHFYENLISGLITHQSITMNRIMKFCCCCLTSRKKIHSETDFSDKSDGCFNNLKKLLIQYYYVFNNKLFLLAILFKML